MKHEFETISYGEFSHVHIFLNHIHYRRPHFHNAWELGLLLEGKAVLTAPGTEMSLSPNTLLILEPNHVHEISAPEGALFLFLQISPRFCREYTTLLKNLHFPQAVFPNCPDTFRSQLLATATSYWENAEPLRCIGWLSFLLAGLAESYAVKGESTPENPVHSRVAHILDYLNENYAKPCNLSDLARQESLSVSYLSGFIRQNLGHSYQQLLQQIRFEHALHFLESGNTNLTEVCLAAGFSSTRYLNQCFCQHFGMTAAQYLQSSGLNNSMSSRTGVQLEQIYTAEESLNYFKKESS